MVQVHCEFEQALRKGDISGGSVAVGQEDAPKLLGRFAPLRSFEQFRASGENRGVSIPSRILRLTVSLAVAAGIVAVCLSLPHIRAAAVVLILLLAILIIANRWGFAEAALATVVGALLLDYFFLPPKGWDMDSAEHWLVFLAFMAVALATSHLAARAKRLTEEAVASHRELEKLDAFGRDLPIEGSAGSIVASCLESLARIFQVTDVVFYDQVTGMITRAGSKKGVLPDDLLREAAGRPDLFLEETTGCLVFPVRFGRQPIGSLAVCGSDISALTFRTIAERIQARLEEVGAHEERRQAEETRKSQELKSAVLDSLVHEIKTPVSVLKTAVTSLMSGDLDASLRSELVNIIDEETDYLDSSINDMFWAARADAGLLRPEKNPHNVRRLVEAALEKLNPRLDRRPLQIEIPDSLPAADFDFYMIKSVLKELLNNALKYSPPGSPLVISAQLANHEILISLQDSGPGVPLEAQSRIFERHYRGRVGGSGAGLGLAIAKTAVEANGGRIGVTSRPGAGSVFHFSLPVSRGDAA
ncbi:MAG: ATP-binding protein [Candidatus Sulfotelmatobacter sp.]